MSCQYHINSEDGFVSVHLAGDVNLVDLYEMCRSILADHTLDPTWPHLIDIRGFEPNIETKALKPFIEFLTTTYRPAIQAPLAVVCDDHANGEITASMYRFTCALGDTELFDDYRLALKWLLREAQHEAAGRSSSGAR